MAEVTPAYCTFSNFIYFPALIYYFSPSIKTTYCTLKPILLVEPCSLDDIHLIDFLNFNSIYCKYSFR